MTQVLVPMTCESGPQLRPLHASDIPRIRELCHQWFPIRYPEQWFQDITSSERFFSLGAVIDGQVEGVIVSETRAQSQCHREDQALVACALGEDPLVTYILTLGVVVSRRRQGIGKLLLQELVSHLRSSGRRGARSRVLFLHVLSTNTDAIRFYESQNFARHRYLPLYYFIEGNCKDGISYVYYLNDGRPPLTCAIAFRLLVSLLTAIPQRLFDLIRTVVCWCKRRISRCVQVPVRFAYRVPRSFDAQNQAVDYHHVASA